jgi:DNA adenine methylase
MNILDTTCLEPNEDLGTIELSSGSDFIKPPFGYFGAKQRLARRIVEMLPPHNAWVEAFCGSAVVTLNKPQAPIEVINDLDSNVVNLFQVLRDSPGELIHAIELTPYAREELAISRYGQDAPLTSLERARRFLVATMMSVNGNTGGKQGGFSFSDSYTRAGREARVNRWRELPSRIPQVVERLRSVRIDKIDAREIVERYSNRPGTLLYLDPPYFTPRRCSYTVDAKDEAFHRELLEQCVAAKCMIIVSGYKSSLYSEHLNRSNGWLARRVIANTRGVGGVDIERAEYIWVNSHFRAAKAKGAVPVRLRRNEAKFKKVNPARGSKK